MAALVIRPRRAVWVLFLALFGYFFVGSVAMAFPAQFGPVLDVLGVEENNRGGITVLGLLLACCFGFFAVLCVVRLMSPVLRVSRDGLAIGKHKLAWTDVEDFRPESPRWGAKVTRVRVLYARGHHLSRSEKLSVALGKLGLYFPPTYIGVMYETGRQNLSEILRYWLVRYRAE
jgi:hypothetical protein